MIDIDAFQRDGFVKVEQAVPTEIADAARNLLWRQIGLSPDEPKSWTQPVAWAADMTGSGPFGASAGSAVPSGALDSLCGTGGWHARPAARRGPGPAHRRVRSAGRGVGECR